VETLWLIMAHQLIQLIDQLRSLVGISDLSAVETLCPPTEAD